MVAECGATVVRCWVCRGLLGWDFGCRGGGGVAAGRRKRESNDE